MTTRYIDDPHLTPLSPYRPNISSLFYHWYTYQNSQRIAYKRTSIVFHQTHMTVHGIWQKNWSGFTLSHQQQLKYVWSHYSSFCLDSAISKKGFKRLKQIVYELCRFRWIRKRRRNRCGLYGLATMRHVLKLYGYSSCWCLLQMTGPNDGRVKRISAKLMPLRRRLMWSTAQLASWVRGLGVFLMTAICTPRTVPSVAAFRRLTPSSHYKYQWPSQSDVTDWCPTLTSHDEMEMEKNHWLQCPMWITSSNEWILYTAGSLGFERIGLEAVSRRFLERLGLVSVLKI